jgi:hypothetical protein
MLVRDDGRSRNMVGRRAMIVGSFDRIGFPSTTSTKIWGAGVNCPPVPLKLRRPRCSLLSALSILVFDKEFFLHQFEANVITVIISFWPEFISFAVISIHNRVKWFLKLHLELCFTRNLKYWKVRKFEQYLVETVIIATWVWPEDCKQKRAKSRYRYLLLLI